MEPEPHYLAENGAKKKEAAPAPAPTPALLLKAKRKYESLYQQITNEPESFNEPYQSCVGHFNLPDFVVDFVACYSYFISWKGGVGPDLSGRRSSGDDMDNWT